MKYTFILPPLTAFALAATLFLSSSGAFAAAVSLQSRAMTGGPNPNTGEVTCYINYNQTMVRMRRFVNFVQISQEDIPVFDHGFGIEKEIAIITNYCVANAIGLCTNQHPSPQFVPLGQTKATGNLFPTPFVWNCP